MINLLPENNNSGFKGEVKKTYNLLDLLKYLFLWSSTVLFLKVMSNFNISLKNRYCEMQVYAKDIGVLYLIFVFSWLVGIISLGGLDLDIISENLFFCIIPVVVSPSTKLEGTTTELNPLTITGFTDAEGCFHVSITKSTDTKINWKTSVIFQFGLHISELPFLLCIQKHFNGVGYITTNVKNSTAYYTVTKFSDIVNVVIPHFLKYPLVSKKAIDFHLFCKIVEVMSTKGHLTMVGLSKIVSFKAGMNKGLTPSLKSTFPDLNEYIPIVNFNYIISDAWLVGFIAGEGCFSVLPQRNHFRTKFNLTQHSRDLELLEAIKSHIGIGYIYSDKNITNYAITSIKDCFNYILPYLAEHPLPESCNKLINFF